MGESRFAGWRQLGAAMVVVASTGAAVHAQTAGSPGDSAEFSAGVEVTRAIVDARGTVVRQMPRSRYRLERFEGGRTRLTMLDTRAGRVTGPMADAYAGITVDTDLATGRLRVRDARGRDIAGPDAPAAWAPPAADDGLLAIPRDRARRREAIERRFGRPMGTIRRLERYLARHGRVVEEMLVAPDTALPVEVNRVEEGALVEHHRFEYATLGDGRMVRARTRSESALANGRGERMVSETVVSDVRVVGGGR